MLVLRWFLDNTRLTQLRRDNGIGKSTAYSYLHEGIDVLAAQAPDLHTALEAAKQAGHTLCRAKTRRMARELAFRRSGAWPSRGDSDAVRLPPRRRILET